MDAAAVAVMNPLEILLYRRRCPSTASGGGRRGLGGYDAGRGAGCCGRLRQSEPDAPAEGARGRGFHLYAVFAQTGAFK